MGVPVNLRKRLVTATAVLPLALVTACGGGDDGSASASEGGDLEGQQMVFVNYGGAGLEAAQQGWLDPFSEQTGVEFATDGPTDPAKIRTMVEAGQTTWDVVDIDVSVGGAECGTLFDERPDDFDLSEINPDYVTDDCGVPIILQTVGVVYNAELYGDNPPTSAEDFMDVENFPGKRIFFNYPVGTVEPLLMADGAAPDEVFPLDWSRVEAAYDELGSEATPLDALAQMNEAVEAGDFGMCLCYLGRIATSVEKGADVGVLWDKVYYAWDGLYAVTGSQAPEAQWEFIQYIATAQGQNPYYEILPYGPTTIGDPPEVKEEFEDFLPQFNEDQIQQEYAYDVDYWTDNIAADTEEWSRITAG
jgi:putative spermidine/putrescine transport system substrate-binding protein